MSRVWQRLSMALAVGSGALVGVIVAIPTASAKVNSHHGHKARHPPATRVRSATTSDPTLYVATSGTNTGNCQTQSAPCASISYAVSQAASLTGGVTITVAAGTYDDHVSISKASWSSLSIDGSTTSATVVDGTSNGIVFNVDPSWSPSSAPPLVILNNLTIQHGDDPSGNDAGGVLNTDSTVDITNCIVSDNTGSGIKTQGEQSPATAPVTTVMNSTISGNTNTGIYDQNSDADNVIRSTISGNGSYGINVTQPGYSQHQNHHY
jgi:hypothetical protein